jgi:hypothetical protein
MEREKQITISKKEFKMSRLTEKDMEILRARGIKSLTTERDFEIPSYKKASKTIQKRSKKALKASNSNANHEWVGKTLRASWGYDMTINDFCKILEVSPTGKTVKCQMVGKETNGLEFGPSGGKAKANNKTYGPVFRLKVNPHGFHGSYPFIIGDTKEKSSYRKGYFNICSSDASYYENHCD